MALVVSADEHLVEPPEFWSTWLPAQLPPEDRARAPTLDGAMLVVNGEVMRTFQLFPDLAARSDRMPGASDLAGRLAAMDAGGIDAALLFPQRAMGMFALRDRALMVRCFTAYNRWLADFCGRSGGRLKGVAVLPTVDAPQTTADYLAMLKELGFTVVMLPGAPRDRKYADAEMAPLWEAIEASGLLLAFHTSETPEDNGPGGLGAYLTVQFQPFRKLWGYLVFSGLLDRYPGVRILFAEGGISWIPAALDHSDQIWRDFADDLEPRLPQPPSRYWHRQCYATFMDDPLGLDHVDHIGRDRVLWSSDYPHPEGTGRRTRDVIDAIRARFAPDDAALIVGGTAAALLGFDVG